MSSAAFFASITKAHAKQQPAEKPRRIIAMYGLPGSGKTYLAKLIKQMFEADKDCELDDVLKVAEKSANALHCEVKQEEKEKGKEKEGAEEENNRARMIPERKCIPAPDSVLIVSANDYFTRPDGSYVFDPKKLSLAHGRAQVKLDEAFINPKIRTIIIDNCNLHKQDLVGYLSQTRISRGASYTLQVVAPPTPWAWSLEWCAKRNVHGITEAILARMGTFDAAIPKLTKASFTIPTKRT